VTDDQFHPTPDRLEAFVEGSLSEADRAVLESHLITCSRCQMEVEEWRALFGLLASLPQIEPAADFADRVMSRVRVRRPWTVRVAALITRLLPGTTTGWAVLTSLLALPVVIIGSVFAWIVSHPGVTPSMLLLFMRDRAWDAVLSLAGQAAGSLMETGIALWILQRAEDLIESGALSHVGIAAAVFGTLTIVSTWILYQNLFRTPTREARYVSSYSF